MRDAAVEEMLRLTENTNGATSKAEAVKAVRMCMDILECMKLVRSFQSYLPYRSV
jgi:hypothetical protein